MVVEKILTILNAVKILEVTLSNLYKLCFDKWGNQNDKFWLVLQAQESFHAENVDEMKKIIISYPNDFIENNKFSIQLINSITIYINGIINELINDKLTEKKLLIKARDIENSDCV